MPFQLSQHLPGIFWFLASLSIYTFILASKCAHESLSLTAHNSCILTHGWASESRISQLHLLMGKSGDKRTDKESLVLWHYPVVRDSSCEELKLSRDSAQLLKEPVRFFDIWTLLSTGTTKICLSLHVRNPGEIGLNQELWNMAS